MTETASRSPLEQMFSGYQCRNGERELKLYGCFTHPDKLNDPDYIRRADERAAALLKELQETAAQLTAYRIALAQRYNYIALAASVPLVRLKRRRNYYDNLVYYDLITGRRLVEDGTEIEDTRQTFPGKERRQAIAAYQAYVKAHPGIIAEMDIEKSRWER